MKYKVKVEDRIFEVEIQDLQTRPIIALVNGEAIEVWPQEETPGASSRRIPPSTRRITLSTGPAGKGQLPVEGRVDGLSGCLVRAPIPGTIQSVLVKPGAEVTIGQELIVLEAMKMKNTIRASRAGQIAAVHVLPGQAVKYNDVLLEYVD